MARRPPVAAALTAAARYGYAQVRMQTVESHLACFLKELMLRRRCTASRLATDIGVRHPTMYRWLSGRDVPSTNSCRKIAEFSGVPLMKILSYSGHAPDALEALPDSWPAFGDYLRGKYPNRLSEGVITVVEGLIEARRHRKQPSTGR